MADVADPSGPTWVVGAGGLLGSAVVRQLSGRSVLTRSVPWADPAAAMQALAAGVRHLSEVADGRGWRVLWCAGSGVTGTAQQSLDDEIAVFENFLGELEHLEGPGCLFLASSAGGVYAGSTGAPFTEAHEPVALAPYGRAKLTMEAAATAWSARSGNRLAIGRIANLYGPGQDLAKGQGLVSHLCRAELRREPIGVYVSLDTVRDYLYVDDAAALVLDLVTRTEQSGSAAPVVKILASGRGVTVGGLLGECRRVFHRIPKVSLGSSPAARFQVRDLRLRSTVWPELDHRALTPLPVGIDRTLQDLRLRLAGSS